MREPGAKTRLARLAGALKGTALPGRFPARRGLVWVLASGAALPVMAGAEKAAREAADSAAGQEVADAGDDPPAGPGWPQYLGPRRDGVYRGGNLAAAWPEAGPPVLWRVRCGAGFAGPAVVGGRLYLFHREGDEEVLESRHAATGEVVWRYAHPATYRDDFGFDNGPRAVPTVSGGTVFTLGADGVLSAVGAADGRRRWTVDTRRQFSAPKGFFGLACSPLVEGDAVLVNIGGADGAGIVAFGRGDGRVLWKATEEEASYASPVAAEVAGKRRVLFLARGGLVGLDPADGMVQFTLPWRARAHASVNGATPLALGGDRVFISSSYGTGAALLRVGEDGSLETIWSGDGIMSNQYATSVHRDGFLYGLDGRHDFAGGTRLRCIAAATGKVHWSEAGLDPANLILAGDHLLVLTEHGELLRVPASPERFREVARLQVLGGGVRAYPALAGGLFFAKANGRLVCLDLRPQG